MIKREEKGSEEEATRWRANWIADIQKRARWEVPVLLGLRRPHLISQVEMTALPTTPVPMMPITPIPTADTTATATDGETHLLSAISLFQPVARQEAKAAQERLTACLSNAVRDFWERHICLPSHAEVSSWAAIIARNIAYFPLDERCAEELGAYTITLIPLSSLAGGQMRVWREVAEGIFRIEEAVISL